MKSSIVLEGVASAVVEKAHKFATEVNNPKEFFKENEVLDKEFWVIYPDFGKAVMGSDIEFTRTVWNKLRVLQEKIEIVILAYEKWLECHDRVWRLEMKYLNLISLWYQVNGFNSRVFKHLGEEINN